MQSFQMGVKICWQSDMILMKAGVLKLIPYLFDGPYKNPHISSEINPVFHWINLSADMGIFVWAIKHVSCQ